MTKQILPYALVVLLGHIGLALPLPILPEMFLDEKRSILPATFSIGTKTILLGCLMMAYPLGQLFGSPVLGQCSDIFGRKKVICLSLCGNAFGYVMTALAAQGHSVAGLFGGLMVCGFSEGNIAIAQAVIADVAESKNKAAQFGWINFCVCLGFIIGPLLGGYLADPVHNASFTFSTPFWLAAFMTLVALLVVITHSKETRIPKEKNASFLTQFRMIWKNRFLKTLFIANFFLYMGIFSFWRYLLVYLERRFNFSSSQLAYVMAYDSIALALALLLLIKPLSKIFSPKKIVVIFSLFLAMMLVVVVLPSSPYALFWTIPLIGIALGVVMTNNTLIVSNAADKNIQGQTMGSLQAVQVGAEIVTAAGGAFVAVVNPSFPLIVGSLMIGVYIWIVNCADQS